MAASTDGRDAWSRRRFLAALATGAVLSLSARGGGTRAASTGPEYPFALGVASGEPAADGFVIWTRIVAAGTRATERPLHGFVALKGDLNTVVGLGFYQHAETPGLGGEVDNPKWKALWPVPRT